MRKRLRPSLISIFVLATGVVLAQSVSDIPDTADLQGGVFVHLGCGTGEKTAKLAARDGVLVHGLDQDPGNVAAARKHLKSLGLYGKVEWSYPATGPVCDLARRENGNVLFADRHNAKEVRPDKTVLWEHKAAKGEEIFTCQPLPGGNVMILCNGSPPRIMEFDTKTGALEKEIRVPTTTKKVHGQFRVARKTSRGTYLLPYLSENKVCELDPHGKVIRTIDNIRGPFQAELLENGNILIGGGYGKQVVEIAPDDSVVWKVGANDLPGEPLKFIAGIQRLPNGNTLIVNWAGHVPHAPTAQILEITPAKEIVWKFNDWESFSAVSSVQVLVASTGK